MSKKSKSRAYKQGMKDAVKPFEDLIAQYRRDLEGTEDILMKIRSDIYGFNRYLNAVGRELDRYQSQVNMLSERDKANYSKLRTIFEYLNRMKESAKITSICCRRCGKALLACQIVCTNCGYVVEDFHQYIESGEGVAAEQEITKISAAIEKVNQSEPLHCYDEFKPIGQHMRKISALSTIAPEELRTKIREVNKLSSDLIEEIDRAHLEVAVVGTVKAGKSMLINALIGSEVASVDATPETSVIAKYHTTENQSFVRISFYKTEEFNALWKDVESSKSSLFRKEYERANALPKKHEYLDHEDIIIPCDTSEELLKEAMRYTKSDSPEHYYVKEMEVGYCSKVFPHNVFLVDTPGLQDPVKYRSDITRNYLKNADFVLACVEVSNLSDEATIRSLQAIFRNINADINKWLILGTQRDKLTEDDLDKKCNLFEKALDDIEKGMSGKFITISAAGHFLMRKHEQGKLSEKNEKDLLRGVLSRVPCEDDEDGWRISEISKPEVSKLVYEYCGINSLIERLEKDVFSQADARVKNQLDNLYKQVREQMRKPLNEFLLQTRELIEDTDKEIDEAEMQQNTFEQKQKDAEKTAKSLKDAIETYNQQCERTHCCELMIKHADLCQSLVCVR